ncbi:MAG TPA: hypothetical protein VMY78_03645 [Solirubrobacteraceae bacterium]|nr:hypothetical protein [Solirubrobacteraceae bacterium]
MPPTADETLADEAARRRPAGAAGIVAGLLTIVGGALAVLAYSDLPTVPLLDAMREQLSASPPAAGLKVRQALYYDDHAAAIIVATLASALAAGAIGLVLSHLYRSTQARRPELRRAIVVAVIAGSTLIAVGELARGLALVIESHNLAGSARPTAEAARDVLSAPVVVAGIVLRLLGTFALGIGLVLLALNAMRVGLLTRFMGVLGIIVGALFVIPLGASLPIVQAFWLAALGALFLGYWPPGLPPAWVTGEAQPWPTQQELREQRLARKSETASTEKAQRPRRQRPEPPETPAPEAPARPAHPSSKKRKRKRR